MYTLRYLEEGRLVTFNYENEQKLLVRELYKQHIKLETEGLECIDENGTVYRPKKKETEKTFATVVFFIEDKGKKKHEYTYGCKYAMKVGDKALVSTMSGLKVVQVISSTQVEKTALPGLCHGKKPQYILGNVHLY